VQQLCYYYKYYYYRPSCVKSKSQSSALFKVDLKTSQLSCG